MNKMIAVSCVSVVIFLLSNIGFLTLERVSVQESEYEISFAYHDIYLLRSHGDEIIEIGDFVQLTDVDPGPSRNPSWSPDGSKLAFEALVWKSDDTATTTAIFVYDLKKSELTTILKNDEASYHHPVWSSSGEYLAYSSDQDGNWEIYTINEDGTDQRRLTENEADDGVLGLTWSPDGETIAFISNRDYRRNISIVNVNPFVEETHESSIVNLNLELSDCLIQEQYDNISWSINNNLAVIVTCQSEINIYSIDMSLMQETRQISSINLTESLPDDVKLTNAGLDWSPSGTDLAFIAIPYPRLEQPYSDYPNNFELFILSIDIADNTISVKQATSSPDIETVFFDPAWRPIQTN